MACQQMGQLVKQRSIHLLLGYFTQTGMKPDLVAPEDSNSCRSPHAGIPPGRDQGSQGRIEVLQCLANFFLKEGISPAKSSGNRSGGDMGTSQ